jgi:uncharacterized phage-associated protein
LQKLLYYAQAWHLALFSKAIFDEDFEAWIHGPVLKSIYKKYNQGAKPIQTEDTDNLEDIFKENLKLKIFFDELFKVYFYRGAFELELMTHQEAPWINAREGLEPLVNTNRKISKTSMREYYGNRAKQK